MNPKGEYINSKYRNSGCGKVNKSPRFGNKAVDTPGPGQCKKYINSDEAGSSINISKQGSYFNSKFTSSKAAKFSRSDRSPAH